MRVRDYQRHNQILRLLKDKGTLEVATLSKQFKISLPTARRDLAILESEGKLLRTFGGAQALAERSLVARTFGEKQAAMNEAKISIAKAAAALIEPGMKLMLDSGTSVWALSRLLKSLTPLTVITSSLAVVEEVGALPGITLFCPGGKFRPANLDFCGPQTQAALARFSADLALLGVDALIPGCGAYATDQESAALIRIMSQHAARRVVLADHSKLESRGFILALERQQIDVLITDGGLAKARRRQLTSEPYRLIVAKQ